MPAARRGEASGAAAGLRRPLVRKYFSALFAAVTLPLLVSGTVDAYLGYREQRVALDALLRLEARAAASRIESFLDGIRDQLAWTVQLPWSEGSDERHRIDALRVMRQAPAVIRLTLVDGEGIERFVFSRVGLNRVGGGIDRSADPGVVGARANKVWWGPIVFDRGSEPVMTVGVGGNRATAGTALADINLKLILEVVSAIRVGETGRAFVIDRPGRLIAHPDLSLVLRGDLSDSSELKALFAALAARPDGTVLTRDPERREVLAAASTIPEVEWAVVAAQPVSEAFGPIVAALWRTVALLGLGAIFAAGLAFWLSRRMTGPIRLLEQGVEQIGAGEFAHRISLSTGDELQRLAERVNAMAGELALSHERSVRIGRLKRFLAPPVAELIERSDDEGLLDSQRADVAVVFGDLRDFTAFAAHAGPEEVMTLLREYYEALGTVIARHEATLTNLAGDGVMVLLNAPVACAEPAAKAIRMASEMQRAVQCIVTAWRGRGHELGFGMGIAFGEATVGRIETGARLDYTAIGPVVNLAARLCQAARDNQILVDAATAAAVRGRIELDAADALALKGIDQPVPVHAVRDMPDGSASSF